MSAQIPRLGLGTWGRTGSRGLEAILTAIEIGYRHLDTAQTYDTESVIGEAIERSGVPRRDFFITTKVADTNLARRDFLPSLRASLERLRVERADLTLIHWPAYRDAVPFDEYMGELVRARDEGSDDTDRGVELSLRAACRKPWRSLVPAAIANNQVEMHPFLQNRTVAACCAAHDVAVTAYLPHRARTGVRRPVLRRVARDHGVDPPAVVARVAAAEGDDCDPRIQPARASRGQLAGRRPAALGRRDGGHRCARSRAAAHRSGQVAGLGLM